MSKKTTTVAVLLLLLAAMSCSQSSSIDVIIRGGTIIDGTGDAGYVSDIAISEGHIAEIRDLSSKRAKRVIDASGMVVTPGFVDMMGGSSLPLMRDPVSAESKLRQGITTMMAGEGQSVAPRKSDGTQSDPEEETWTTFDDYFPLLEKKGIPLNVIHNVGAARVREMVLGDKDQDPDAEQLAQMKQLVEQAMADGAVGLSSALIYPPGAYAKTEELIELCGVAARHGGVYFTHVRNEGGGLLEALDEAIRIGKAAGIPVHIFHLKAAGQENWPLMAQAIELIENVRAEGLQVTADIYPYIRNGIGLGSFIHPRHYADGAEPFLETLADPLVRKEVRQEIETTSDWENWYRHVGQDWGNVLITRIRSEPDRGYVGMSVGEVAAKRGIDSWDAFFDLVISGAGVAPKSMNEEQKHQAMRASFVCFDNDAGPTNPERVASAHPRAFGAFPRVLAKYVREEGIITLQEAIRKLTSLPASILGLEGRGTIESGKVADLLVFDQNEVQDRATFADPLQYSEGMDYVFVGGVPVIDGGQMTGALPGEVIRHKY
jgi:N-acyl-D-aspartate/D-glutamate deacylase